MGHLLEQPFVLTTGFAALIHSTWSLATLFNGPEPVQWSGPWFGWVIPALLIAFSVDVGQIITASEIRSGQRSGMKYATFATFAIATYLLQWFHLANHIPELTLASGVLADQIALAQFLREAMLWCIPALLPVSTLLYTFSSGKVEQQEKQIAAPQAIAAVQINISQPEPLTGQIAIEELQPLAITEGAFPISCPYCDWSKQCPTERSAKNSLTAHKRGCKGAINASRIANSSVYSGSADRD